ncbi:MULTISPECIES: restriction endonuclease subunit S [Vibrio]|uniref:restriction endonuclease subunit S n=1 Tax=Vibrio TaxID=662 RepID=UPI0019D45D17|nr:restriction endonuclease subunit S [Vibrio vulnificus]EGR1041370.1 restriction endonuclease subunit S [Vibrio cholerae]EJL3954642.1 restriction endonuclease subunit S [Vibrio cholerae]EJT0553099.1 restriction endonuclease subunit S [Vibrio vulnificus]MBN8131122.1 restriction endonuclease subunit S [Vibrio vulnificus]MBN8137444.1 restriction endonuclease subunit S [Vibrio vulnificus]
MTGNPIPLNDFITLQRGHDLPHKNRVEGNVPVVASTGIAGYHNEAKAKAPGVILGRSGSIGGGQYITEDYWPLNTTLWVKDFKGHNERFIYYLLKSIDFSSFNVGSGVPTLNRNHLSSILIDDKGRQFEDKVAKILGDIDDKIAVNIQINQTLEQIAQAIFKSWFVDFDPVKAKIEALAAGGNADDAELAAMGVISAKTLDELNSLKASNPEQFNKLAQTATLFPKDLDSETGTPAGWNSGVIADIAKLNANSWTKKNRPEQVHYVDLSNTKNGRIETVTTYGFDEAPSRARRILNSGDTIIGTVRPGNRAFAFIGETEKPLTGSTGFAVLSPKEEFWTSFVYLATTNDDAIDEYARLADGGAYPAIKPEVVADTPCVLPTKDIAQKFWRLTGAMLKKAHQARLENEELAKTRDTLLPKLLSGEINVTSEVVE